MDPPDTSNAPKQPVALGPKCDKNSPTTNAEKVLINQALKQLVKALGHKIKCFVT